MDNSSTIRFWFAHFPLKQQAYKAQTSGVVIDLECNKINFGEVSVTPEFIVKRETGAHHLLFSGRVKRDTALN